MRIAIIAPLIAAAVLATACDSTTAPPTAEEMLEEVRQLTAPYADIATAQAAGYTVWAPDPAAANATCASSPQGRMGYHRVNVSLRGSPGDAINADAELDYRRPEMLLYEKTASGQLRLVGVEYLVFKAAWERAHGSGAAPPELFGQEVPFSRHAFAPGGPEIDHYELHVWVHSDNPNGTFSHWNPNITC
jgi:hypothetical protein